MNFFTIQISDGTVLDVNRSEVMMTDLSTTLLLVRHGQARAEDGSYVPDTPLSELGVRSTH